MADQNIKSITACGGMVGELRKAHVKMELKRRLCRSFCIRVLGWVATTTAEKSTTNKFKISAKVLAFCHPPCHSMLRGTCARNHRRPFDWIHFLFHFLPINKQFGPNIFAYPLRVLFRFLSIKQTKFNSLHTPLPDKKFTATSQFPAWFLFSASVVALSSLLAITIRLCLRVLRSPP